MSAFGQSLVGNANCGTVNPLMQMAGQMQSMGSSIADARTYVGVDKGGVLGGPSASASMASAMRPQQQGGGADASAFMHAYQQGPKQHGPMASMPLHVQQQQQAAQQRAMQQMAAQRMIQPQQQSRPLQPGGPDFADQFMAMELQHKQQKEFEHIFAGGQAQHHPQQGDPWAMDFAAKEAQHRQQHMMAAQSQQHAMMRAQAAQHGQHTSHWGRGGGGMMMGGGMYAPQMMGGHGMYAPHMQHQMHMGPSSIAASQSSVQIQEVPDSTAAGPASSASAQADDQDADDNLYAEAATDNEFEEAYRNATGYGSQADWGSQYNADAAHAPAGQQESNMAGGMSKQMLDDLMKSDNPKWRNSKFLKFIDKISKGEIEFKDNQAIDKGPQPQRTAGSEEWAGEYAQNSAQLGAEWADQFSTQKHHPASWGDSASASSSSASAQAAMAEGQNADAQWLEDYAASAEADTEFRDFDWAAALAKAKESIPERKDPSYTFTDASQNPSVGTDPALAFDRGVQLFHEGKLTEAILAFESVVQSVPDHADAWSYLGEAQAHNEEETNAIAAFLKCVSIDPYNLKALLQLGVSYTNDLEESRALNYLKTWLQNNPDYQSASLTQAKNQADEFAAMYGSNKNNGMYSYDNNLHDDVTQMFLNALTLRPDDADLHTVLGVLYHISSDFDKAIEAFKAAVKLKPDDAALWNKLGATQANSSRSSDAVFAYKRALQLRPTYVRTLANLAISYANQGMHEEAVRTYLTTLTHNPDANHVWSYLRISLSHLQRDDLVELSHKKDAQLFRPFFQF